MQLLQVIASKQVNASIQEGCAVEDREITQDRYARALIRRLDEGWSLLTARRRRDIIAAFEEQSSRIELGVDPTAGDRKGGRKRRRRKKVVWSGVTAIEPQFGGV